MYKVLGRLITVFLVVFSFVWFFVSVKAQSNDSVLILSPFLIEQDVNRGQIINKSVWVTNDSPFPKHLIISLQDFIPSGRDGGQEFLPPGHYASSASGLARWITITDQPVDILPSKETAKVDFQIKVPVEAEAGAHYGGLVFSLRDSLQTPGVSETIQQAAVIVILDVDRSFERAEIEEFKFSPIGNLPEQLKIRTQIRNIGLSSLKPKGRIVVYNIFGQAVGVSYVNPDALTVLPQTSRVFLSQLPIYNYFGKYRAELTLYYGSKHLEVLAKTSFWIIPWNKVFLYFIYLLVGIIIFFVLIKRYNRWLINKTRKF